MKISVFGSYGEHNLGDEAVLDSLLLFLTTECKAQVNVFTHNSVKSAKIHTFPHVHFRPMIASGPRSFIQQYKNGDWKQSIHLLKQTDLIIIGGGGLFYEEEVSHSGIGPITIWFIRAFVFKYIVKRPYILLGVGMNSVHKSWNEFALKKIIEWADYVLVRDKKSLGVARKVLGDTATEKMEYSRDLAWYRSYNIQKHEENKRMKIGIQIRKVLNMDMRKFKNTISATIEYLIENLHCDIVFLPLSFQDPDDRVLMKQVIAMSNHQKHMSLIECASPERVVEEFSKLDYLITTRYHGIILGIGSGLVPVVLSYGRKTKSLMNDINAQMLKKVDNYDAFIPYFDIQEATIEDIVSGLQYIIRHKESLQKKLDQYEKESRSSLTMDLQRVLQRRQ